MSWSVTTLPMLAVTKALISKVTVVPDVKATDFPSRTVKSGSSIESARPRTAAARLAAANRAAEKRVAVKVDASSNGQHEIVPAVRAGRAVVTGSGDNR